MAWPKNLVLVRHAESEGNIRTVEEKAKLDISTHAYKLTERGRHQAAVTGRYLRKEFGKFDLYYVSYYQRSKETMAIMYPNACVYEDPRLAEAQRGIWSTMTEGQVRNRFPEEFDRREREGPYHYRPLGGENWPDVELRIESFLSALSRECCANKSVLIVVHGHWLVLFRRLIHHFTIEEAIRDYKNDTAENASVTVYGSEGTGDDSKLVFKDYFVPRKEEL